MRIFLLLFAMFYAASMIQTSFLAHFQMFGFVPGLVILLWIACNIWLGWGSSEGLATSIFAGLFTDLFSSSFFGLWTGVFLVFSFGIQFMQRQYVRLPSL